MFITRIFLLIIPVCFFLSCENDETGKAYVELQQVLVGSTEIDLSGGIMEGLPVDQSISLIFTLPIDRESAISSITLNSRGQDTETNISFSNQDKTVLLYPVNVLNSNTLYTLELTDQLKGAKGESFAAKDISFSTGVGDLEIVSITIGGNSISGTGRVTDVPLNLSMLIQFSVPVNEGSLEEAGELDGPNAPSLQYDLSDDGKTATITTVSPLHQLTEYEFTISEALVGEQGEPFSEFSLDFYTAIDPTPKFPVITDEELLTKVQQTTFKYFWDFAHPTSGMARERNTSGDLVTSGGSGFGIMSLVVGIERNFVTRAQGLERMDKILDFLETSDRFHGAWSHWIDGNTGAVIPFSPNDNGGDLVETSFLVQGLITFRQYLNESEPSEEALISRINALTEAVEWDWYTRNGQDVLYWHWSPSVDWAMNHQIKGWNECLITYVLAASSPTHNIMKDAYDVGWASNGAMQNGKTFEGTVLPLGPDYGGPLFFSHYSFLGIDPSRVNDGYANYWDQNVSHSQINYKYCVRNPLDYVGYNESCWGLTASDNQSGYSAHSPTNDLGVITPTAALSSFPYTPEESMNALKFFYYTFGDRLWGEYGFYDAFNITAGWTASSYLAIDQGPIIVMIENYRTGLLWDLFMSAPEVEQGLNTLGFTVEN